MSNTLSVHLSPWTTSFVLMTQIYFSYLLVHVTLIQAQLVYRLVRHISRTTVNLLTLNIPLQLNFFLQDSNNLPRNTHLLIQHCQLCWQTWLYLWWTRYSVRTNLSARSRPCYTRKTSLYPSLLLSKHSHLQCNSYKYRSWISQINLPKIHSLANAMLKAHKSAHVSPIVKILNWLTVTETYSIQRLSL